MAMPRQRMYLFERAYVDYAARLKRFFLYFMRICRSIWNWFWKGKGADVIEVILRIFVVASGIAMGVLYVLYERNRGRGFSVGMLFAFLILTAYIIVLMWGWKAPLHFATKIISGASPAGLVLIISVLALAIVSAVFLVYLIVLFLLTAMSMVIFLPMRTAHSFWLLRRRITYQCPYDDCSYRGLPIHICSCGHEYNDLKPSFYGIFHHTCYHDKQKAKLPTMDFLGRNKLPRLCGKCRRPLILSSIGELPEHPIAIVGGVSSGKTVFLTQAICKLSEYAQKTQGGTVNIDSEDQKRDFDYSHELLNRGQTPPKTIGNEVQAFGLSIRIPKQLRCLLYLFDSPGEHFETMARFGRKQVVQYLSGIILLVDPFSSTSLYDYSNRFGDGLKPSEVQLHEIVSILVDGISQMFAMRPNDKCNIPLAVVLDKADAFPVQEFPFLADLVPSEKSQMDDSLHIRCREALEKLGEGRCIRALELKFSNIRYFACSALGRMPEPRDTRSFQPIGVVEPLLWLLKLGQNKGTAKK